MYEYTDEQLSDEDAETVWQYAENRMNAGEARSFRQRMVREPALRKALSELIVSTRGTEYEKILEERNRTVSGFGDKIRSFLSEIPEMLHPFSKPAAAFAGACLIAVLAVYSLYFRPETPLPLRIRILTSPEKIMPDMRGDIRDLPSGGIVKSGEYFSITVESDAPRYIIAILHDSSGEISLLGEGRAEKGKPLPISGGEGGFQLDNQTGKERVYVIALESPVSDLPQKMMQLRSQGIDSIGEVFGEAEIQTFAFEHR